MNRGAFCAVLDGDKVLLVRALTHADFDDHWSLPGGLVEDGETFETGAVREVLEETGVTCEIVDRIQVIDNDVDNITVHIFKASYVSGEFVLQTEEIEAARWFTLAEAVTLPLAFDTTPLLETLLDEL